MQTSGIGNRNDWVRFMELTSEARMRNRGLTGAESARTTAAAGRMDTVGAARTAAAVPVRRPLPIAGSYGVAPPVRETRILGGRFDAYA